MNVVELLERQAAARPEATALIDARGGPARRLTFRELDQAVGRCAAQLARVGLQPGDVVLVFLPVSVDLYVFLGAAFRLGLVAMFVDPSAGRAHLERCCELARPRALVATWKGHLWRLVMPALRRIPLKFSTRERLPGTIMLEATGLDAEPTPSFAARDGSPALLTFTSGSTGEPKPVLRTHRFLEAQHAVLERALALRAGQLELATLPIFMLANLASGLATLIPPGDLRRLHTMDPRAVVAAMAAFRPDRATAMPAFFERLVDHCEHTQTRLPAVRRIFTGGAPIFPRFVERLRGVAPEAAVTAVYGATEVEPIALHDWDTTTPDDWAAMLGGQGLLVGLPVPEIRVRVLPDPWAKPCSRYTAAEFDAMCLGPDRIGELVVSGAHVLADPGPGDGTPTFTVDGIPWRRTGDAGYLDGRGQLWLLGRCAARVSDDRGTLYPFAVECAAHQDPRVRRAALIGHRGRRLLVAEPRDRADAPGLVTLRGVLAWAQLDAVRVVPRLPVDRRHRSKIDYPALRQLLERA